MAQDWKRMILLAGAGCAMLVAAMAGTARASPGPADQDGEPQSSASAPGSYKEQVLHTWKSITERIVEMADDFPEDKYDFRPAYPAEVPHAGHVDTFAEKVLVAAWLAYYWQAMVDGKKLPERPPKREDFKNKAEIVAYVRKAFADGTAVIMKTDLSKTIQGPHGPISGRQFWGELGEIPDQIHLQLLDYYRVMGLVPPESRGEAPRPVATAPRPKYVWIPPGTFMMGCSPGDGDCGRDEMPAHRVTISKGFWMGQTEVTVAAYERFASATAREMPHSPDFNKGWANQNMPVVKVTWDEAQAYCQWSGGRLPTEAEWEYAARGGSGEARYGDLDKIAWYRQNSGSRTQEVAQKQANGFALYDTLGNVYEWVNDWYDENYYRNSPSQDPSGPSSGEYRVLRGGSWLDWPSPVRVSYRYHYNPASGNDFSGLRCVKEANAP